MVSILRQEAGLIDFAIESRKRFLLGIECTFLLSADQKVSKDESLVTDNGKVIKRLCRA